jgi:hypothetical protein
MNVLALLRNKTSQNLTFQGISTWFHAAAYLLGSEFYAIYSIYQLQKVQNRGEIVMSVNTS